MKFPKVGFRSKGGGRDKELPKVNAKDTGTPIEELGIPGSLWYRVERFIAQQWKKIFIAYSIALVFMSLSVMRAQQAAEREVLGMQKILREHLNRVLVATPDGRLVQVARKPINAALLRAQIEYFIRNYLILDKFAFMEGGSSSFPQTLEDAWNVDRVEILKEFFTQKTMPILRAYIKYVYGLGKADRLPEIIRIDRFYEPKFETDGNEFSYKAVAQVKVLFVGLDQKWHYGVGRIDIGVSGFFKPELASTNNPYGLKITRLAKIKYVEKTQ